MRVQLSEKALLEALNADGEFRIAARYWDGSIDFVVGGSHHLVKLRQGKVAEVTTDEQTPGVGDVVISAPELDWARLLEPLPKPFYLEYYSASQYHDFAIGGDMETLWAYYAAVLRTTEILRAIAVVGGEG